MLSNYLRIALRNLWKNKFLTFINIIGLAVGMAITLLSLLYVTNELFYDHFHEHKDQIHRIIVKHESVAEGTETTSVFTAGVGPSFLQRIPEIEYMVRVSGPDDCFFKYENKNYTAENAMYADSTFFEMFSFPLIIGDPETALKDPYRVVLTKSFAEKMFASCNEAIGKMLILNERDNFMVTAIVEDPPINSHLKFDVLLSFESLYKDPQMHLGWNGGWNFCTYVLLHQGANIQQIEKQFETIAYENINKEMAEIGVSWNFFLQPLIKIHLNTNVSWDIETKGSRTNMLLFVGVTFIILVIACINFINLTTANALTRMKEVGVRKVSGASRRQIIAQFLTESMLVSFVALIHAILLIEVFHLWVSSQVTDKVFLENFELYNRSYFQLIGIILFLIVVVGFVAGGYPAMFISSFRPSLAIKGKIHFNKRTPFVRNLLVVFQFTIAIIFIVSTLVIATQLEFLLKTNKGFKTEDKLVVSLNSEKSRMDVDAIKEAFLSIPGIEKVGASSNIPGQGFTMNGYFPEGHDKPLMFHALDIDYNYLSSMDIDVVIGRNFSKSFGQDADAYLINQTMAHQLGWVKPVGKTIRRDGDHKIIGVVKDFNFSPLHVDIEPLVITLKPWRGYAYLTLQTSGITQELLKKTERKWKSVIPYEDFVAFGLDDYVRDAYGGEKQFMQMLLFCACLTIFIAALGLFGLSAFITRQRYREIAVRKVFGAGMKRIFTLISAAFVKWVLVANLIAWPIAYLLMENYFLINFAYSNGIKWWVFLIALFSSILIAGLVIFFQIVRLGRLNPIDYIRHE